MAGIERDHPIGTSHVVLPHRALENSRHEEESGRIFRMLLAGAIAKRAALHCAFADCFQRARDDSGTNPGPILPRARPPSKPLPGAARLQTDLSLEAGCQKVVWHGSQ